MECPGFSANSTNVSLVPIASRLVAIHRGSNYTDLADLYEACDCSTFRSHEEDVSQCVSSYRYKHAYYALRYAQ